ncbi:hypothetical protein CLU79DRAFT_751450 [Phycomyces nitens]|nr:hypothetical protein CLU79DRAFT_751450 [Phycomyces nitens]
MNPTAQEAPPLPWPSKKGAPTTTTSAEVVNSTITASDLPQPQNSNHISTAPFKDKLLTNSSYLAAEIPLKLGHFMSNLWTSGSELSSSLFLQRDASSSGKLPSSLWLIGQRYELPDNHIDVQENMMDAQTQDMQIKQFEMCDSDQTEPKTRSSPQFSMSLLWPPDFYADFTSRLWMTYRHNYPPIRPSNHTTDIGWGCMLRSGQSLLANALMIHMLGRDWRRTGPEDPSWKEYRKIVHWFLDELSPRAPFSIHRIALLGKQLGKNIGEWFGPSTISQVIQALVSDFPPAAMAVCIATDGVIYHEDVRDVATGKKPRGEFGYLSSRLHDLHEDHGRAEAMAIYNRYNPPSIPSHVSEGVFKPVLLLVALRLGIESLHPTYHAALKACFELPCFVGIAGGRPNSSLYFIGLQGDELIYLDPHFSRPALETKNVSEYSEKDLSTYHCAIPRKIHISQVDPSMLLGFYCQTQEDFDIFCSQISEISKHCTPIFTIEQRAPEYDEDVRSENDFGIVSDEEEEEEEKEKDDDDEMRLEDEDTPFNVV